jgi:hypothetical protein
MKPMGQERKKYNSYKWNPWVKNAKNIIYINESRGSRTQQFIGVIQKSLDYLLT